MQLRVILILLTFFIVYEVFADNISSDDSLINQAEKYIITDHLDSAVFNLNKVKDSTYSDYVLFLKEDIISSKKIEYYNLNKFLTEVYHKAKITPDLISTYIINHPISAPNITDKLNEDYIYLINSYIISLTETGYIKEGSMFHDQYYSYLKHYSTQTNLWKIAHVGFNSYPILMALLEKDVKKGNRLCEENISLAKTIEDNKFLIKAYTLYLPFIMLNGDLDKYINTCYEIIDLENQRDFMTPEYDVVISSLLDALIYQFELYNDYDILDEIIDLLHLSHKSSSSLMKLGSYRYAVKFLGSIEEGSPVEKSIYTLFNVKDIHELCDLTIKESKLSYSDFDLIKIYLLIINTLKSKGYYERALDISIVSNELIEKHYSQDLSKSIANHNVKVARREEQHAKELLETRSKIYIYSSIFTFLIMVIILFFVRLLKLKNKALGKSNREKHLLLKEIHHRIKNNLQLATGFLQIQFRNIKDERISLYVKQWMLKVDAIVHVHQYLYQNDSLKVELLEYLNTILSNMTQLYSSVIIKIDIDIVDRYYVNNDTAVKIGLIINELVTNSVKYAVNCNNELCITIRCSKALECYQLVYKDSGIDYLTKDSGVNQESSFGFTLINSLCSQLDGKFVRKATNDIEIVFKDENRFN